LQFGDESCLMALRDAGAKD